LGKRIIFRPWRFHIQHMFFHKHLQFPSGLDLCRQCVFLCAKRSMLRDSLLDVKRFAAISPPFSAFGRTWLMEKERYEWSRRFGWTDPLIL